MGALFRIEVRSDAFYLNVIRFVYIKLMLIDIECCRNEKFGYIICLFVLCKQNDE